MILGMEPKIRSIGPLVPKLWLSLDLAVKEFTNVAGSVTSFAGSVNLFALAGYHDQGRDDLNVFQKDAERG